MRPILMVLAAVALAGCWDTVQHVYDCGETPATDTDVDADADGDSDADGDADADGGPDGSTQGQGDLPDGWEGFGSACESDEDCKDYPADNKRCISNVLGIINTPGSYCTACCDYEEIDGCAPGIDCVGANGVYLVCLAHCESDDQCRESEGYECREIYYIPDVFPGTYCLPNESVMQPDTDEPPQDLDCPWPWS